MIKKILFILVFLSLSINSVFAEDILLKISPIQPLATTGKNIFEGDIVKFKVLEDVANFSKNDILTATILEYDPNGFCTKEANLIIGNFSKQDGTPISGKLYLSGSSHKVYQEYVNNEASVTIPIPFIRGGEINVKSGEILSFFTNVESNNSQIISLKIQPNELVSTCNDEIQIKDIIHFKTVEDIYKNKKLFIKKGSNVLGYVDFIEENGWNYDNAQIDIKEFKTRDVDGNLVVINSPLSINGFEILKYKSNKSAQFFNYIGVLFRGKEIEIIPQKDTDVTFNIWLNNSK